MKIKYSLIGLACLTVAACGGGSSDDNSSSSGSGSGSGTSNNGGKIAYDGHSYPLDNGVERVSDQIHFPAKNHYVCTFHITDGELYTAQPNATIGDYTNYWYARNASAKLRIVLYSPGNRTRISPGTFAWVPDGTDKNDPKIAQSFVFRGSVSIDTNSNRKFDGETFDVTGGTISVEVVSTAAKNKQDGVYDVNFNFSLENGESVSGSYRGELDLVQAL